MKAARLRGTHTPAEWLKLKAQWDFRCLKCWRREPEIKLTKDHIVAIGTGEATDAIGNLQPLCLTCNVSRGFWGDFRAIRQRPHLWLPKSQKPPQAAWNRSADQVWFILRTKEIFHGRYWGDRWKTGRRIIPDKLVKGWMPEDIFEGETLEKKEEVHDSIGDGEEGRRGAQESTLAGTQVGDCQ